MTKQMRNWSPSTFRDFQKHVEHDSCGIVSVMEKKRIPTKKNIDDCINALITMNHRAGFINEEGDGVGIHIDIPKAVWKEKLTEANQDASIADRSDFVVGHFFIDQTANAQATKTEIKAKMVSCGFDLVYETDNVTNTDALGPLGRKEEPVFWQVALLPAFELSQLNETLFKLVIDIEENKLVHVASLSNYYAIYKVMGAGDVLPRYYHDLANPLVASTMTLGHNRYSTNTLSNFFRVQPFSIIGHNGEINTIAKLRDEARMLDIPLVDGASDSQDLNRVIETLIYRHNFSLFEALDVLFPPIVNEIKGMPDHLQDLYAYVREAWGHFAQGPAGIISRFGDEAAFSVDALGLRPVWMTETESSFYFASEQGIVSSSEFVAEPKPLAPGEKVGLQWKEDNLQVIFHDDYQELVFNRMSERVNVEGSRKRLSTPQMKDEKNTVTSLPLKITNGHYSAFGWDREHIQMVEQMADKGVEPIRSLGHDAPLATLHQGRKNIADFIKESVAVVTNPAIDRDREMEHFSTRVILGKRPSLFDHETDHTNLELVSPIVLEGATGAKLAEAGEQPSYNQVVSYYKELQASHILSATFGENETVAEALQRLVDDAAEAIANGAQLIVLDDEQAHSDNHLWLDPHLVVSAIDQGLTEKQIRRDCSIAIRSGSIRSLHDIAVIFGLGADIVSPYLMFATVTGEDAAPGVKLFEALNKGLEKVISTIGIHELRGYGRLFSAIGLNNEVSDVLNIVNFLGSDSLSFNFDKMKADAVGRREDFSDEKARPGKTFHFFPRIWKAIGDIASGNGEYSAYADKLKEQEENNPISIRHLTDLKEVSSSVNPESVDLAVQNHSLPFIISSMSFGSQNEIAFRAYAEAADRLNMISFNGEGGEIKDMLGKYPNTRGQQVASGRFGVNAELINSTNLIEIKIGQGAKPGEGGHLPGSKVTDKVAAARNATTGSDLISPSNNHDIYSIEDLAQMVTEIKTANDQAKVCVKVPIVPNIGTIAVGVAKAGADYITLSGFDGGTGAARVHALQHVGLPVEIGVKAAHNALIESGLRHKVELWADGGIKSALDVVKVMLLGANRIGFGTLSMIAVGCTTCRGCHLDTCHVGIATQIESEAQAKEHGLRRFVPRQFDLAVEGLMNMFNAFGKEVQALAASLGVARVQDLVGRSDLLVQARGTEAMDLQNMLDVLSAQDVAVLPQFETAASSEEQKLAVAAGAEYLDYRVEDLGKSREFSNVTAEQRILGSRVSCHRVRGKLDGSYRDLPEISLSFKDGSIPGNGLGAYNSDGIAIHVDGGAQDGVGKTAFGGSFMIFKAKGKDGQYYNGSVGKGTGYGAQQGIFMIQGNADVRAGIRLSGADMIFGGRLTKPVKTSGANLGVDANIKGFAFEYMTNGRGLVLGDPGPWICAGMTGGVVYLRHQPEMGLTEEAIQARIAKGAKVEIESLSDKGIADVTELLTAYQERLTAFGHTEEASVIAGLLENVEDNFLQVIPVKQQADPSVSTE
ncbi:glutamate synthase-related protein [Alkalihalobacillus sp. LMS39]|uniref:glutamate synthase-related protein n=1 Tax=Alkalihalobacillus sp. LMS39 TaxID=2924032 RepID=UPI001FB3E568|nr:glutamate synthase-related protein [Alkalihalobacillus sp. LMS39]UOE95033.1 glutamate synthase-related protein [Alkalihalobacillus sp. LMS39]